MYEKAEFCKRGKWWKESLVAHEVSKIKIDYSSNPKFYQHGKLSLQVSITSL